MTKTYDANSIKSMDPMEHIRHRPGMYIGGTDAAAAQHCLKEVVDNALDEAQAGHCDTVWVALSKDSNTVTVRDNGRGIPVGVRKDGKNSLTVAVGTPQSGGKFDKDSYKTSAGLHGVGVKATNATAEKFQVIVWQKGKTWTQTFSKGKPTSKVVPHKVKGPKHGTEITFTPDAAIFKGLSPFFNSKKIIAWLRTLAHLVPGLTFHFTHNGETTKIIGKGLGGYVESIAKKASTKLQHDPIEVSTKDGTVHVALAWVAWTEEPLTDIRGYVNLSHTPDGGTHIAGFRKAVVEALRSAYPKCKASPDELMDNMVAIVSVKVAEPKFKAQTKGSLMNTETEKDVRDAVKDALTDSFSKGKGRKIAKAVVDRAAELAKVRESTKKLRIAANAVSGSKNPRTIMPDKLAASDPKCPPGERELFVVEGDGAGGTAKKGRDSYYQEILPLRGKIINAMAHATAKVMGNTEVQALVLATGVKLDLRDHTKNDYSKLRVGKIILLADADPDGRHIESLVLAFVVQYAPELITRKMVYIAKSPLFRAVSRNGNQRWYADSLEGLEKKSGKKVAQMQIARLKGHGEASADDIAGYALSPATRKHILLSLESKCVKRVRGLMSEDVTAKKALMGIEETA